MGPLALNLKTQGENNEIESGTFERPLYWRSEVHEISVKSANKSALNPYKTCNYHIGFHDVFY